MVSSTSGQTGTPARTQRPTSNISPLSSGVPMIARRQQPTLGVGPADEGLERLDRAVDERDDGLVWARARGARPRARAERESPAAEPAVEGVLVERRPAVPFFFAATWRCRRCGSALGRPRAVPSPRSRCSRGSCLLATTENVVFSLSAIRAASSASATSVLQQEANSSPPSRAATSHGGSGPGGGRPPRQELVTRGVALLSLMFLKWSRSMKRTAGRRAVLSRASARSPGR